MFWTVTGRWILGIRAGQRERNTTQRQCYVLSCHRHMILYLTLHAPQLCYIKTSLDVMISLASPVAQNHVYSIYERCSVWFMVKKRYMLLDDTFASFEQLAQRCAFIIHTFIGIYNFVSPKSNWFPCCPHRSNIGVEKNNPLLHLHNPTTLETLKHKWTN